MKKDKDMLEEYDFSKGIQGKYAKRYAEGTKGKMRDTSLILEKNKPEVVLIREVSLYF